MGILVILIVFEADIVRLIVPETPLVGHELLERNRNKLVNVLSDTITGRIPCLRNGAKLPERVRCWSCFLIMPTFIDLLFQKCFDLEGFRKEQVKSMKNANLKFRLLMGLSPFMYGNENKICTFLYLVIMQVSRVMQYYSARLSAQMNRREIWYQMNIMI